MSRFIIFTFALMLATTVVANAQNNCNYWYVKIDSSKFSKKSKKERETDEQRLARLREDIRSGKVQVLSTPYELKPNEELYGLTPKQIEKGIECFLKLENNTNEASISGATRVDVSQLFENAKVNVAALYYISYLYHKKWDSFAEAIALIGADNKYSSPETVSKAYKYYREWFKEVKKIGIVKAREQGLDPLKGKDVRWY